MHVYEIRPHKHKGGVDRGVAVLMSMRSRGASDPSPEFETSGHVVIALAPLIGCDWALPACRRWSGDVLLPFRDSSRFRRQSPDCCAHRTLNVPNSVLEL